MARRKGPVERAVEGDLQRMRLTTSALGQTSLELARQLDNKTESAAAKATCARALIRSLERVRELTPAAPSEKPTPTKEERDGVADLAARRASRRRKADA